MSENLETQSTETNIDSYKPSIKLTCSACRAHLDAEAHFYGKEVDCPHCQKKIMIPVPSCHDGQILGSFKIIGWLGKGGMGEVYLGERLQDKKLVAIKILSPEYATEINIARFQSEIKVMLYFQHINIVHGYEAGHSEKIHYLAMEYIDGESLDWVVKRHKQLPEDRALQIIIKVAQGLAYAWNTYNVIHCDVKPANIMIDASETVKITDLGLTKQVITEDILELENNGAVVGTPNYMSPEQAKNQELDFRSDIYSLGASLYNLLTGSVPHPGKTVTEVVNMVAFQEPRDIQQINSRLQLTTVRLLNKMLAKEPNARHSSWEECIEEAQNARDVIVKRKNSVSFAPGQEGSLLTYSVFEEDKKFKIKLIIAIFIVLMIVLFIVGIILENGFHYMRTPV